MLHNKFIDELRSKHGVVRMTCPMAHCRLNAGKWLQRHGWRIQHDPVNKSTVPRDGDVLALTFRPRKDVGTKEVHAAIESGAWPDGKPFGVVRRMACLKSHLADVIFDGRKWLEGRVKGHPIATAQPGDAIEFQVAGETRDNPRRANYLYARVLERFEHDSFREMLTHAGHSVTDFLPNGPYDLDAAVHAYKFDYTAEKYLKRDRGGKPVEPGAVSLHVAPLGRL